MIHSIFYSWQSDLPEIDNKTYIGSCLSKALAKLKKEIEFSVEYVIDRSTSNRIGTIDIAQTIFNKINVAKLLIADVSIINCRSRKYRKTSNPNVLIELGYAVRTIGWENVICIFNTKYGNPKDLPFDIRNRRLLLYNSDNEKSILINDLYHIIKGNSVAQVPSDVIRDFYNASIYTSLFNLISDCYKIYYGYDKSITIEDVKSVLELDEESIRKALSNQIFIGFQLFKSYPSIIEELRLQLEKILAIRQYNDNYYVPLVQIINMLELHDKILSRRMKIDALELISNNDSNNYTTIHNEYAEKLPNRFLLLRKIEGTEKLGVVVDFGDIIRKDHQKELLHGFKLLDKSLGFYVRFYSSLIIAINKWIDNNGGEFILDETRLELYSSKNNDF